MCNQAAEARYCKKQTYPHRVDLRKAQCEAQENEGREDTKFDIALHFLVKVPGKGIPLYNLSLSLMKIFMNDLTDNVIMYIIPP
jgi:hypothetical protein